MGIGKAQNKTPPYRTQIIPLSRASLTLYGSDSVSTYYPCGTGSCPTSVNDYGTVTMVVNGTSVSTSYNINSTPALLASALVSALHSSTITATANGGTINFTAATAGPSGNGLVVTTSAASGNTGTYRNAQGGYSQLFFGSSFTWNASSATLTGGALPGTVYDTGTVTVTVNGSSVGTANYGNGATTSTLASALASSINGNSGSLVNGSASGAALTLSCRTSCPGAVFTTGATVSNADTADFPSGSFTTQVKQAVANPTPTLLNESYSYDPWGNLQQTGSFTFTPTFSTSNQMTTYSFDAAGNETNDGLGNTFLYDGYGRFQGANGYKIYSYDVRGNRVQSSATTPTEYVYFGNQLIATAYGTSLSTSTWTDYIYGGGGLLAEVAGTQTALPTYRVADHLSSLGGTIDNTGNFSGELSFAPFGQTVSGSTSDAFRFTGLEFDTFTGLDHATARQFHPNQGRWISPDLFSGSYNWADPQSLNRYSYVGNRPMIFVDPSGQVQCAPVPDAAGFVISCTTSIIGDSICGPLCGTVLGAATGALVGSLEAIFGFGPSHFNGTLKARPSASNDSRQLDKSQCDAANTVLAREAKFGTAQAARMSSNTFGDAVLAPFNSTYVPNIQSPDGPIDVDWFTDLSATHWALYPAAKIGWSVARKLSGLQIGNFLPFSDPGERTAFLDAVSGTHYSDIFTQDVLKGCPK